MSQSLIEQFRAEDAANGYTPGKNVRPALEVAASTSADQQARSMQLAEELGLSREVASEQREWAEQESKARRIESNPVFASWTELSPTNAAFARDDTEKMGDVFEMLFDAERSAHAESGAQASANIVRGVLQYNARRGDKEAQARLQREDGWTEEEIQNGVIRQTPMPGTLVQLGESYKEGWQGAAKSVAGFFAMLGENMGKAVHTWQGQDMAPVWEKMAKGAREALDYAETAHSVPLNAQGWLNDAARNFYQLPLAVTTIGLAGPAALTGIMGTQIAGGTYADLTQKHEVRMPTAAELEEGARMLASAASQGWQGAVNNARMASHEAGGEGGDLYTGNEPDELAMTSARARMIAAAILNAPQSVPTGTAALAALGNAMVQAPLEAVGLGKFVDAFKTTGLVNIARRIAEAIGTDLVTETLQQHPDEFSRIWAEGVARGDGWQDVWKQYTGQFWDITKEGLYAGTLSIPFAVLGGIGKAATDVRMAREAVDWAQAHVAFHAKVEETKAKKVAPAVIKDALEKGGMHDIAHVDGEALYQLGQEDPLVLQQLGIEEKAAQQAAEAGQMISIPMSSVHARMQPEQMPKFMAIARVSPDAWTAKEADTLPETLKQTAERATEEVARKTEEARQAEVEIVRIREEIIQAAASVPGLKAKLQSEGTSVENYTDTNLEIIVREARYLAKNSGRTIADILRERTYEGLDYDPTGKLVPVSRLRDTKRMEEERARAEADRPFWELVWGRLDPESVKADYAETYKELRKSKRGLFMSKAKGGVPLDQIAAELNERGIFTGSADDLLELLKTKERPRRGYYQEQELTEEEEKAEAAQRVQEWLSAENLAWAEGKGTEEIFAHFGNELETVALLPDAYLDYFSGQSADNRVYSGKGYIIDHAVNHHADIAAEEYGNLQAILDAPDEVLRDTRPNEKGEVRDGLIFIKKIDKTYGIAVTMEADRGMIVMHKSFFKTRKGAFKKLERLPIAPVGSTSSTIQSEGGTFPGGSLSALGAESSIAQGGEEVNSLEQRAFHGSPHRFMKFMLDHIGSGEGAQAHGWGLYFAKDRATAEEYRKKLTGGHSEYLVVDGRKYWYREGLNEGAWIDEATGRPAMYYDQDHLSRMYQKAHGAGNDEPYLAAVEEWLQDEQYDEEQRAIMRKQLDEYLNVMPTIEQPGQVFEVDIPDMDVLLDEQKPFEEQPEKVKEALRALIEKEGLAGAQGLGEIIEGKRTGRDSNGHYIYGAIRAALALRVDSIQFEAYSEEASKLLHKYGIQGITYDGREDGRCFVVFDDQAIDMLDTFYQLQQGRTVTRGEAVPAERSGGMGDVVRLFYHANLSTLVHESAHVFFLQMKRLVENGEANERMKADYATLCKWVGSEDGYLTRAQHETLAKGMELFLREGKAPSKRLETAFARFRNWLLEVYKTVAGNPYFKEDGKQVELNPEVRNVFSRILATQEEVEAQATADLMGQDYAAQLDALGVTGAQRVAITGLFMDAKNRAETDLQRRREADKRERLAEWRREAAKEIEGERVYQARTALRARKGYGLDMLALANVVGNERAAEFFRVLPGVKREGASPWEFAARFGYDSVEEFVNEVIAAPTKTARMAELMAAKEQEFDRQHKAESLIASEEAAQIAEQMEGHIIKAMGSKDRGVPLAQIRKAASDLLAGLPIDQAMNVGKFRYQAKRLTMAMNEAILRQDFQRALDLNFKLRLNMELTREAQKRREEFDALRKNLQQFTNSKEPNPVARYGVARLAMKFGLLSRSQMIARTEGDKDLNDVTGWIEAAKAAGYPVEYDAELWLADLPSWHAMNSGLFRRLYSQLNSMMTVERNMRHVEVQGRRIALDQYSGELAQHMLENDPNREELGFASDESLVKATRDFLDPLSTVNTRLKMYDGFQHLGMMWRAIMEPMNKAEANQIVFFKKYGKMLNDLIQKHYDRKQRVLMKDRVQIEGLPKPVSKEMCIMVGMNWGNAGNRLRLLNGFKNTKTMQKYGEREIMLMLEQLDENDWQFIQGVWDFFEQFKKESFDMEERLTGVRPLEVEATPVRTKYGTLRGGYFPIAYDPKRGAKALNIEQMAASKNVMMPSVFHGMMKDRTDEGLGTPLLLDFGVITDKLVETAHNLCYREPVIEVAKLLRSRAVASAIADTEGPTVQLKFWKWLASIAGEKPTRNSMDKIASWATSRMAIFAMGFKMTTMIAQASGLLATSTQIGRKWTLRGISDTFNGGSLAKIKDMWQDTCARSPMMMGRMNSFDRDVYAMSKKLFQSGHKNMALDLVKRTEAWLTEHAFTATGFIQLWMVDIPTWRGAFAKGMEELNMTEEEAALYADDMVVTAQGSGATKDLSDIMREKGFMRLMTMFYSYFNAMYNMFLMQTSKTLRHPKEEWPYLASMAFVLWFVEPVVTGLITGRGPEEDEEWYEWALMNGVKQPFQMIPVLRDLSGAYFNHIEGKFGSDYRFTPAADVIGAFEKVLEHGEDLISGNNTKKAVKGLARDIGMISGTPFLSSQAITTVGNMYDWLDGTEEFALRDLFFTRKK